MGQHKLYKSGFSTGLIRDVTRPDWDGLDVRPVSWSAWYPVPENAIVSERLFGGKPDRPLFTMGSVSDCTYISDANEKWPLVLLSHGTGGSAETMGWLGRRLASHGYVCIGVNHHGNTSIEPYRAEGFICWWERASDLSCILDHLNEITPVKNRIDSGNISVIGFSLGGYTALSLVGAITSMDQFQNWLDDDPIDNDGPREFPDLGSNIPRLMSSSTTFRNSWSKHEMSFKDNRIKRCISIAPAPPVRAFLADSLAEISCPTTIIAGEADTEAPFDQCAAWLKAKNAGFILHSLGPDVGHYVFICECTKFGLEVEPGICFDPGQVNRSRLHDELADGIIREFLASL